MEGELLQGVRGIDAPGTAGVDREISVAKDFAVLKLGVGICLTVSRFDRRIGRHDLVV